MIISLENLSSGLAWWRSDSKWGRDVMNGEYGEIFADLDLGIQSGWWERALGRLGRWRAYRGRKKPNSRAEIGALGAAKLEQIDVEYQKLAVRSSGEPCIADFTWKEVASLYSLAYGVKSSPVFAGKMCHFLLPNLFVVMDNWAVDAFDYEIYWRGMRDAWCSFTGKDAARKMLIDAIRPDAILNPRYPIETKIIELCHIGQKHGSGNS
jgi:hypothetical protein